MFKQDVLVFSNRFRSSNTINDTANLVTFWSLKAGLDDLWSESLVLLFGNGLKAMNR